MSRRKVLLVAIAVLLLVLSVFVYMHASMKNRAEERPETDVKIRDSGEELYVVRDNGRYGYINNMGLVVIKPQFEDGYGFSEGMARVAMYHKYGFIDKSGRLAIDAVFDDAGDFSEGLAMVAIDNRYGFIDKAGQRIVPLDYELVGSFSEGLAGVYINGKWGYINTKGETVIEPRFESAGMFRDGFAAVSERGLYGYIDKSGRYRIKPSFDYAYDFSEGLAEIGMKGKYGFVDTQGRVVIKPEFESILDFSEGRAAVLHNKKWGYIDKKGSFVIDPIYEMADSFSEGRAAVFDGRYWGYIDEKGSQVIQPKYTYAEKFYQGLAAVRMEEVYSYVDSKGKLVWHAVEDIDIAGPEGKLGRLVKMTIKSEQYDFIIKYPHMVDMQDKELQAKINELLKQQSGTDYKGRPEETYRQDYDVLLNKNGIVSILDNSDMYMKGAAHGMSMRSAINIDMATGRLLDLKDLFKANADYKSKLNNIIKKRLAQDNIPLLRDFAGINDKQEYYLMDKELVVYYQLYDYTPYAYGFLEFYIPYESIRDIIDKKGALGRVLE